MLSDYPVYATLPTADVERLRRFYEDVLGFKVREEDGAGSSTRRARRLSSRSQRASGKASGSHTQMAFAVANIETTVAEIRASGAVFEELRDAEDGRRRGRDARRQGGVGEDPDGNLIGMIELRT